MTTELIQLTNQPKTAGGIALIIDIRNVKRGTSFIGGVPRRKIPLLQHLRRKEHSCAILQKNGDGNVINQSIDRIDNLFR